MKTTFYFKTFLLLLLFVIIYYSNNIQAQNKSESKPDVHINVNREFDEKGNVIKYDSTYSWSWSSDGSQGINDSISAKFPQILNNKSFFDNPFSNQFNLLLIRFAHVIATYSTGSEANKQLYVKNTQVVKYQSHTSVYMTKADKQLTLFDN